MSLVGSQEPSNCIGVHANLYSTPVRAGAGKAHIIKDGRSAGRGFDGTRVRHRSPREKHPAAEDSVRHVLCRLDAQTAARATTRDRSHHPSPLDDADPEVRGSIPLQFSRQPLQRHVGALVEIPAHSRRG
jgi:hypothetical protein